MKNTNSLFRILTALMAFVSFIASAILLFNKYYEKFKKKTVSFTTKIDEKSNEEKERIEE